MKKKKKLYYAEDLWKERNYLNILVWNWLSAKFWAELGTQNVYMNIGHVKTNIIS